MYRSSSAQLANLKRREPKSGVRRGAAMSVRLTEETREFYRERAEQEGVTVADLLEAIAQNLQKSDLTLTDFLKKLEG